MLKTPLNILCFCLCFSYTSRAIETKKANPSQINQWLNSHCLECHDEDIQKGDRRFDELSTQLPWKPNEAEHWLDILHQLQYESMPPPKKSDLKDKSRQTFIHWVQEGLSMSAQQVQIQSSAQSHRLTKREIKYRLQDFFEWPSRSFDPTEPLPKMSLDHGYDNYQEHLRVSNDWAKKMLISARRAVDYTWDLLGLETSRVFKSRHQLNTTHQPYKGSVYGVRGKEKKVVYLSESLRNTKSFYKAKLFLGEKPLPHSGYYEIEVKASAVNRFHPYGKGLMEVMGKYKHNYKKLFFDKSQAMILAVGSGSRASRNSEPPNKLCSITLEDHHESTYRLHFWANKGDYLYFYYENGPAFDGTKKQFISWVGHKYHPEIKEMTQEEKSNLDVRYKRDKKYIDYYQGPEIHISAAELKGPFKFNKDLKIQQKLFALLPAHSINPDTKKLQQALRKLSEDLFQRPDPIDIQPYLHLVQQGLHDGRNYSQALKPALVAMICSPEFLYHAQKNVSPYQKAISFVWQSPFNVQSSDTSQLTALNPKQLDAILINPKHQRMLDSFITQWLKLHQLGTMPPDAKTHPLYYLESLEISMKEETLMFFHHLYDNNLPVSEIVRSDYGFINRGLSHLYDLPHKTSGQLVKTIRPKRRGLLSQASILSLTSNGIETSPVKRGVWVLETLLGAPLSPPPPDVPAIEPDIRGTKTVFEQLKKHRDVKSCATCHDKIDPLGLTLENFDPIGAFRKNYSNGHPVVTTSQYRDHELNGAESLQQLLEKNIPFMAKNLLRQSMSYAIARPLTWKDEALLEKSFQEWESNGLKFRDLFKTILMSDLFSERSTLEE